MAGNTRRVLLVAGPAAGGLRTHLTALARHLALRGWPVTVAAPALTLQLLADRPDPGIQLVAAPIGGRSPAPAAAAHRMVRSLAGGHDVVHAHGLRAAAVAALASGRTPLISTWHNAPLDSALLGSLRPGQAGHGLLERLVARRCRLVLVVSPDLAQRAERAGARRVSLIEVPAPPPPAAATPGGTPAPARPGVPAGRPLLLTVARLERQKALDTLIRAAAEWQGPHDPVVWVAGDGPLQRRLDRLARHLRAPVALLGERRDVPELLAAADAFVLPSRWEGWPLALAEALRAGLPAVVSDLPGTRRLAGQAAVYIPPGRPAALRAAIETVLADATLRDRLTAAARQRSRQWLTLEQANDGLLKRYLEVS